MRGFAKSLWIILFAALLTGCKSADNPAASPTTTASASSPTAVAVSSPSPSSTTTPSVDPCALLTKEDLKTVQGEEMKEASRSDQPSPDYIATQCYYSLPTAANSVVINLTMQKPGGKSVKELWEGMFEKGKAGEEEEDQAKPEKISGLGQESFWLASRVGGALFVLKKDTIFRISVGGAGDVKTKLNKSKTLASKALARL